MTKKINFSERIQDSEYLHYIESLKTLIKHSEESRNDLHHLQHSALNEEKSLQNCLNNLKHLEEVKKQEELQWKIRAQQLEQKKRELEMQAQYHSQTLALSKANLEHSLRMINLFPGSTSDDYLKGTNSSNSISESLRKDWSRVGDQLASSIYELRKLREE